MVKLSGLVVVLSTEAPAKAARVSDSLLPDEALRARTQMFVKDSLDPNSLIAKTLAKIIANMQLVVERVSVRFVDRHTDHAGSALGLLCASASLLSTDVAWRETTASPKDAVFYKQARVVNIALYHDTTGKNVHDNEALIRYFIFLKNSFF